MIISEFYDDDRTLTYGDDSCILTANITDLGVTAADIDKAYLMGYVDPDYVPQISHLTRIDVVSSGEADYIEFVDVTDKKNIPWMYTSGANATGSATVIGEKGCAYRTDNSNGWNFIQAAPSLGAHFMQFINSLKISNAGERIINVNLIAYTIDTVDTTKNKFWSGGNSLITFTNTSEFLDWLNGDVTKQVSIQASSSPGFSPTLDITGTDFSEGEHEIDVDYGEEVGRFKMFIYVTGMQISSTRGIGSNGTMGLYPVVTVTYHHTSTDGIDWLYKIGGLCGLRFAGVTSGDPYFLQFTTAQLYDETYTDTNQGFISDGKRYVFGGFTGRIPYRWLIESAVGEVIKHDRTLIRKYSAYQNSVRIHMFFLTSDMLRIAQQWIRLQLTGTLEYGFSDNVGVPKYKDDNSPAWNILTGDFETIEDDLQPWQIDDIKYNPFTIDDVPPYNPEPPGPGDENTGTDIRRPTGLGVGGTNGFITQYALTASQMAEIGRLLWLNFTDADYYKNFLFALTTTGSIDISNLMDYFVSLRVYPFPLINVPSWAAAGQDMYIGAGVIPLHFTSTIHTINNYADYIDAGSCEVPRYFNDFRDFTHTQILLFLPYCGTVQLNPADVIGGTLYAQYAIDFASGGVNAYVDLATHDGRYFMIASLSGNIGADIPLTATNAAQIASKIAGDALNFAGTIGGAAAGDLGNRIGGAVSALTGNAIGVAGAAAGLVTQPIQGAASIAQEGMRIATSDGVKIPMLSGGRGFGSFGQPQTAYIQIRRGMYVEGQTAPQGFKHAFGEAYDQPVQVGSCSGYTVFDNIDTSGLSCTDAERAAIVKQMQQGIFI